MRSAEPLLVAPLVAATLGVLLWASAVPAEAAPPLNLADTPLFLAPPVPPNVMLVLDNSQSMDATMEGMLVPGERSDTRSNIARGVLRSLLNTYRDSFNWGLTTFATSGTTLYSTYAYYLGNASTMVYVNDCVDGFSASTSLRCIANPQPANGFASITYQRSSDDADINDAYYGAPNGPQLYGIGSSGNSYEVYYSRDATVGWGSDNFSGGGAVVKLVETDSGYVPDVTDSPRQLGLLRGWGYANAVTGQGDIVEPVKASSAEHLARLKALLQPHTNGNTAEIKNAAMFTPLVGSLRTVRDYLLDTARTPVTQSCQSNFIVLATDGNPTARLDGMPYSLSERSNSRADTAWQFGKAQQDLFGEIGELRKAKAGTEQGVRTYVVGLGDSVDTPSSVATLNRVAELGGTGSALLGNSVGTLEAAFQSIVGNIQSRSASGSSVSLNAGSYDAGAVVYQARFSALDWSGDVLALPLAGPSGDLDSGTSKLASAAAQLKAQNWNTQRAILTRNAASGLGVAFRWPAAPDTPAPNELDTTQTGALGRDSAEQADTLGELRLNWLRGDASQELRVGASGVAGFRARLNTPLGDIVNSAPQFVGAPASAYPDSLEASAYSAFVAAHKNRAPMVYVGANDGMLHAFNAGDLSERLAYVPSMLFPALPKLTDPAYRDRHRYFVDGTPVVADVFTAGAWRSLLVSGLRAGGRGLFALDVTDPQAFTEANAANLVKWEFQDPDMGHVFGQPLLVKTNNGRWSVIVSNGYNAGAGSDSQSVLFVIDADTGLLVRKIATGAGTAASPNGLSAPVAIDTDGDAIVDVVYAGDLDGKLWKFDLSQSASDAWGLANAGSPLFAAPAGQAITSRPDVTPHPRGGYLVAFGTGRYIDVSDAKAQTQTMQAAYGIWDTSATDAVTTVALSALQPQSILAATSGKDGNTYRLSSHAVGAAADGDAAEQVSSAADYYLNKRGWVVKLPEMGERIVADAHFRGGRVVFTSITPSASCSGGSSWILEFDAFTGNRLETATFDTDKSNDLNQDDYLLFAGYEASPKNTSGRRIDGIVSGPAFMLNRSSGTTVEDKYLNTAKGTVERVRETAGKGSEGRLMWREVR